MKNGITEIVNSEFMSFQNLKSVDLPESIQSLGNDEDPIFINQNSSIKINFNGTLSQWCNINFLNAVSTVVQSTDDTYEPGVDLYIKNNKIQKLTTPNDISIINPFTFAATSIEHLRITENVKSIGYGAFALCQSLDTLIIDEGLETLGALVFWGCMGLKTVSLPRSLKRLDETFRDCYGLTTVNFSEGLEVLGYSAFNCCTHLDNIILPKSLKELGQFTFYYCVNLSHIEIPEGVVEIPSDCFLSCTKLAQVTLPNTITILSNNSFSNCTSLSSITLPESLTSIGGYAFGGCTSLKTINFKGTEDQWNAISKGSSWNENCPSDMVVIYNYQGE